MVQNADPTQSNQAIQQAGQISQQASQTAQQNAGALGDNSNLASATTTDITMNKQGITVLGSGEGTSTALAKLANTINQSS